MYYSFWRPSSATSQYASIWQPTYSIELYHHGIKGQKWGVRRFQNYDGSRTAAGKARDDKRKWDHSDNPYQGLAVAGLMVAGGAGWTALTGDLRGAYIAAIGLAMVPQQIKTIGHGIAEKNRTKNLKTDEETGLKLKDPSKQWTPEEDMNAVNPEYSTGKYNVAARHNCVLCSLTFDLRRRGYDVTANRAETGWQTEDLEHWYPGFKTKDTSLYSKIPKDIKEYYDNLKHEPKSYADRSAYADKAVRDLSREKTGTRGVVLVRWAGGQGGHAMSYEVHKDGPHIYDAQVRKEYKTKEDLRTLLMNTDSMQVGRLDHLKPDPNTIREVTRH